MRVLDLFSGIGGFSLGLERAGMETVAFCEFDKKAQLVLKKHWPDVPIFDDIKELTLERILENTGRTLQQRVSLVCGGFPCQPWSAAGKQQGHQDSKGRDLWPEMLRVIREVKPRWVLGENVQGFINKEMGLRRTVSDLEGEGYQVRTFVIPACGVNAPHQRYRVWIIGRKRDVANPNNPRDRTSKHENFKDREKADQRRGKQPLNQFGRHSKNENGGNWDIESRVGRVAHGVPGRVDRLKQLGNAVVPQIVQQIGEAIMEAENEL